MTKSEFALPPLHGAVHAVSCSVMVQCVQCHAVSWCTAWHCRAMYPLLVRKAGNSCPHLHQTAFGELMRPPCSLKHQMALLSCSAYTPSTAEPLHYIPPYSQPFTRHTYTHPWWIHVPNL